MLMCLGFRPPETAFLFVANDDSDMVQGVSDFCGMPSRRVFEGPKHYQLRASARK